MTIELLYFEDCPHYPSALDRLRQAMAEEKLAAPLDQIAVADGAEAQARRFLGSPTIRVNGLDIEVAARTRTGFGLACRRYDSDGLPPTAMIRAALRVASTPRRGRGAPLASLAAMGSVLAASSCCLPVLPFVFAAGFAGSSAFLARARPYLLAASVALIAFAFIQSWRAKRCHRQVGVLGSTVLWISTTFVVLALFFPQVMANAAVSLLSR